MKFKKFGNNYILRVETGEDIFDKVMELAEKENIKLASLSGIGAVGEFTLGVFDRTEKKYAESSYKGDYEITALVGNITTMDKKQYVHLHMTAAGKDLNAVGGHLFKSKVSLTAEIFITVFEGEAERKYDDSVGINLIQL